MLKDTMKELKDSGVVMESVPGICRFCGQSNLVEVEGHNTSQEDIDELASECCKCAGSTIYVRKLSQKEQCHKNLETLCKPGFGFGDKENRERTVAMLQSVADIIADGNIISAAFNDGDGSTIKITMTPKGFIRTTRGKSQQVSIDA